MEAQLHIGPVPNSSSSQTLDRNRKMFPILFLAGRLSHFQFIAHHLAQLAPPRRPGNNIYFIHPLGGYYLADLVQVDPLLRNEDLLLVSHGAVLDMQMIQRNWPDAVKVSGDRAADQWYLGTEDRRRAIPGSKNERHFVVAHIPR